MALCFARRATLLAVVLLLGAAPALRAQAVPAWLDGSASTRANAGNAVRASTPPGDATRALLGAGDDPAQVVAAVVDAYARCDAVYESVRAAVQLAPGRAGDVVQAAASTARCPCGGEALWQRSRLEQRIRIEQRRNPLLIAPLCGCAAAGAEAAAAAAPERADEVLEAALGAGRRASAVVDALGQVGAAEGPASGTAGVLVRVAGQACRRDAAAEDAFALGALWQAGTLDPGALAAGANCADSSGDNADDSEAASSTSDLSLAGYLSDARDQVLVLRNGTANEVDLAAGNYQVELHFPDQHDAGRRIALNGRVAPGAFHVLAGRDSSSAWLARADQVVASRLLGPRESVVLRRGLERDGCDCALAGVAGTVNGLGPAGREWLAVQAGGTGATPLLTADRVGQVRPETFELAQWRSPLAPAPLQLARADGECSAERRAEAPFVLGSPWREGDAQAAAVRCAATPSALLLAQLQSWAPATQDAPPARAVRIANSTGANIDLAKDGYVLEVYGDGARAPTHVIPLRGELASGASLSVASSGVPEETRRSAAVVDDQLAQRALDAVVLRRLATAAGGMCRAEVYAAASTVGAPPIVIASQPDPLPEGEPRTDESPIDPDRGGDLASPN